MASPRSSGSSLPRRSRRSAQESVASVLRPWSFSRRRCRMPMLLLPSNAAAILRPGATRPRATKLSIPLRKWEMGNWPCPRVVPSQARPTTNREPETGSSGPPAGGPALTSAVAVSAGCWWLPHVEKLPAKDWRSVLQFIESLVATAPVTPLACRLRLARAAGEQASRRARSRLVCTRLLPPPAPQVALRHVSPSPGGLLKTRRLGFLPRRPPSHPPAPPSFPHVLSHAKRLGAI